VLYYHTEPQRQLLREHRQDLAHEMRRARRLTRDEAGYPGWAGLGAVLLGRAKRPRGKRYDAPAYEA
jgi:hypothetical protein